MSNISKIQLPNGTTYDINDESKLPLTGGTVTGPVSFGDAVTIDEATIGDLVVNGQANFIQGVKSTQITPIMAKTYTDVIGTANNWAGATFFYGAIKPTSWDDTWRIRYKINVYVPNHQNYRQMADVMVTGSQGAFKSYYSFNTIGQYYVCYYHELYRLKQAGFNNGYGHSLGLRFYSAYNPIDTGYKRTIEIEIYELTNCTFEFYDECLLYASIPGTGSTNYDTYTEMDFVNNGMQETSDSNDPNYQNRIYYAYAQAKEDIYRYQIIFRAEDGNLIPASDANNSFTIGAKNYTTTPFNPFAEIYYLNSSSTYTVGNNVGNAILYRQYLADLRYAFDVDTGNNKLVGSKPVYLTARPQSDGMAVLETAQDSIYGPIVQTLPSTDDGLIYIYLGQVYPETNPYRMELMVNHPIYWYKDGQVRPYVREPLTINGHTVESNVPSNAQFTDTITTVTTTGSGNAVTAITASNGALTVTKGSTFSTSDTKVTQSYKTASEYTYWRPLLIGYSSGSAASFTPSDQTNLAYTFATLKVQPSTGTIRVNNLALYKGSYTTTFTPTTLTADRTITIPDKTGTMALTSDITSAIEDLPQPMLFKGSVGTGGTVTSLPAAAASNEGYTYKVITALTTPVTAKVGDTVISNGTEWVVIPSGDEPSGTVTSVGISNGGGLSVSGSPITSSGTITVSHADTSSQASSSNSGRTYIQSITLDTYGHVTGISTATETVTNTDEKLKVAEVTSATQYYPIVGTGTTAATRQYDTTGFKYKGTTGTTSAVGSAIVELGNSTASGTAGNKQGQLIMYGTNAKKATITLAAPSDNIALALPTSGGTLALTSQIPTVPSSTGSATTGISIAAHGTGTVTGVQSSTTSVRGVKTGTDSTTTASKVTLGTAISVPNVTGNSDVTVPIRADADTTVPTAASSATTVPIKATSATTVPIKNTSATSIPNVTAVGSGSASLTFTMDTTDTKKLKIAFSHTHTAPTLGTEISIIGVQSSTTSVTGVQSSTTSVTGVSGSTTVRGVKTGTNSTTTASKVTLGTAKSIPNVTAATDVTVPIRADADTTVPIKNTSASTFVTGTTHTVTDNGHTHTI